jgi:DnaJ domain
MQQAQTWHPDKLKANATLPIEEINGRFAQIAQAYQTLSDPHKRQAYDQFLKECEYMRQQQKTRRPPTHASDDFSNQHQRRRESNRNHHQHSNNNNNNPPNRHHSSPTSIRQERDMFVDPMTGAPMMRETTYEEYGHDNYYCIKIQDYLIQSMDSWGNVYYQPLYPYPRVVDEGPIHHGNPYNGYSNQQEPNSRHEEKLFKAGSSTLENGDVLMSGTMLVSKNQRYRARVDKFCQLVIETRRISSAYDDPVPQLEIEVLWKSNNEMPLYGGNDKCFLAFDDGGLILAGGSSAFHTGEILWFSSVPDYHDEDANSLFSDHVYTAKLEDDGKLVVYRTSTTRHSDQEPICVWATGPMGCVRTVSRLLHMLRVGRDRLGPALQHIFNYQADSDSNNPFRNHQKGEQFYEKEDKTTVFSDWIESAKRVSKDTFDATMQKLFGFGSSSDTNNAFHNNQKSQESHWAEDKAILFSGLLRRAKRAVSRLNCARRDVEASLEKQTLQWVQRSISRLQEHRAGTR